MFEHDPDTNRLSLTGPPPWMRNVSTDCADQRQSWLYCSECKECLFWSGGKQPKHVPFRDRASQCCVKPTKMTCGEVAVAGNIGGTIEPECEPSIEENAEQDASNDYEPVPELPEPAAPRPSLDEYKEKWERLLALHSRCVPGPFSHDNLVPWPDNRLWQDCPHVPFDKLRSEEAQARLSVCRPISGIVAANVIGGVPTYAHNTGEVNFRRRAPLQLAATLG